MNEGIQKYTSRLFSRGADGKQDYKAKLWSAPVDGRDDMDVAEMPACPYADQIRHVVAHMQSGVAFQSLAVACLQTLRSVLLAEQQASRAAISLAQGEKLKEMLHTTRTTAEAIAEVLDNQGSQMLNLTSEDEAEPDSERSWWFALTEAIEAVEDGTNRILSLASGQPKSGAGRQLSSVVVRLLRKQHHQLLAEADAWIS